MDVTRVSFTHTPLTKKCSQPVTFYSTHKSVAELFLSHSLRLDFWLFLSPLGPGQHAVQICQFKHATAGYFEGFQHNLQLSGDVRWWGGVRAVLLNVLDMLVVVGRPQLYLWWIMDEVMGDRHSYWLGRLCLKAPFNLHLLSRRVHWKSIKMWQLCFIWWPLK